jgi:hypothetical protein
MNANNSVVIVRLARIALEDNKRFSPHHPHSPPMKPASVIHLSSRVLLVFLLLSLSANPAQAQNEANSWIFGNKAWLKFPIGGGSPVSLSGALMDAGEGSSAMSDQTGNLLFSTDGRTVWNKNNVQMPIGPNLHGASSSTQSALIVPWPNSGCKKYFVFTAKDAQPNQPQQLEYSIVDINAPTGGGLGDVTTLNTLLKTGVAEKLAAVKDATGTGFWVVAHGFRQTTVAQPNPPENKEFYAYHVTNTSNGTNLVGTEVMSAVGSAHQRVSGDHTQSIGQMKISPNGKLITCAVLGGFVEILDFDTNTGLVTGPAKTFDSANGIFGSNPPGGGFYGVEFSPDSQQLYVSTMTFWGPVNKLYQISFLGPPVATLLATGAPSPPNIDIGQLQLGPDNKIYVARDPKSFISVINFPNIPGPSCNFQSNGPALSSGNCRYGLPAVIAGNFSCAPTPTPTQTPTPTPSPTVTPAPTPLQTPTSTTTPAGSPTGTCNPCCPPWSSVIWAVVVVFSLLLFKAPITRFLGR